MGQRVRHLHADVTGTDHHRPLGTIRQRLVEREAVVHGVQDVHPRKVHARERRHDRLGPGPDDQLIVGKIQSSAPWLADAHLPVR